VYACRATTASGETHAAATNVGVRPMFVTGRGELIEAFLLDFDGDLYGQPLRLEFLKRLRGEKRFETVEALIEQMNRDVDEARAIAG
jgi:riboflavin kinase/FMN adenylyltransferase